MAIDTPQPTANDDYHPDRLTWAAMLGRWIEFAQSSLALPSDAAGRRLRASVVDIITLQAVWFALGDMDSLDATQQLVGLDRAEHLIDRHERQLHERWHDDPLPEQLVELIDDARSRLAEMEGRFTPGQGAPACDEDEPAK